MNTATALVKLSLTLTSRHGIGVSRRTHPNAATQVCITAFVNKDSTGPSRSHDGGPTASRVWAVCSASHCQLVAAPQPTSATGTSSGAPWEPLSSKPGRQRADRYRMLGAELVRIVVYKEGRQDITRRVEDEDEVK